MEDNFATGYMLGSDKNDGNGFGGGWGGGWIWIILIIAIFFGGFNGLGGFGGGNGWQRSSVQDNYVLTSDFAMVDRKLDGLANGLCDLGYTQAQLINGVSTTVMQGNNALQAQVAQCCCDTREGIAGVNYNMATQTANLSRQMFECCCDNKQALAQIRYDMASNTRDITENANQNTRAILEAMCNDKIERLTSENQSLKLAASQAAQNAYLIGQLRPAFQVPNPYNGCGCCGFGA